MKMGRDYKHSLENINRGLMQCINDLNFSQFFIPGAPDCSTTLNELKEWHTRLTKYSPDDLSTKLNYRRFLKWSAENDFWW
jgi:hypothetical protein